MAPWVRRLIYLLAVIVWFVLITFPFFAFSLAARQQLQLGSAENNHVRIFLIQERDAEGIGLEIARPDGVDAACTQTSVRYFMWSGEPENVTYCQCREPGTGDALPASAGPCSSR